MTAWMETLLFVAGAFFGFLSAIVLFTLMAIVSREASKTEAMQRAAATRVTPKVQLVEELLDIEPPGGYA